MQKRKVVQYLSKYIKGLNADQVSSRLFSGEVELRDAEFEVDPLRKLLLGTLPFTWEVLAISCDRLQVQVPWSALRSRAVQVKVGKLRVQVADNRFRRWKRGMEAAEVELSANGKSERWRSTAAPTQLGRSLWRPARPLPIRKNHRRNEKMKSRRVSGSQT
ncbi:unnamed protein product [Cladocopium goreaui]|uniref:Bridge-like lipid transfer protein family member 3B (Syntaxin-6 Habc-interacting protein of 164 kDa) (UHRF1-binding protein 1-like) n=1 Tax=Cladocopium goreaui TaxID=2562237 RepID=A0A9P1GFI6_9DINO|nr:unnamed protein product [Cladocopium goreaui]